MAYVKHRVLTPPTAEPVSLEDVKVYLRLIPGDDSEDEAVLKPLIGAAREYCENITGRALAAQTVAAYPVAGQQTISLPMPPLIQVDAIMAHGADGTRAALETSDYFVDEIAGQVFLERVPDGLRVVNPIEILYRTGYEEIPPAIRQAMLLLVGHWYENREAVEVGAVASTEVGMTARALLNQYRVWWF